MYTTRPLYYDWGYLTEREGQNTFFIYTPLWQSGALPASYWREEEKRGVCHGVISHFMLPATEEKKKKGAFVMESFHISCFHPPGNRDAASAESVIHCHWQCTFCSIFYCCTIKCFKIICKQQSDKQVDMRQFPFLTWLQQYLIAIKCLDKRIIHKCAMKTRNSWSYKTDPIWSDQNTWVHRKTKQRRMRKRTEFLKQACELSAVFVVFFVFVFVFVWALGGFCCGGAGQGLGVGAFFIINFLI